MVLIHPDAANEIRAAAFAYQDVAHDLSQAFVDDLERAIERASTGGVASVYGLPDGVRAMSLERFGYRLYFYERDARLYLVACRRIPRLLRANAVRFAS
jgi:hypothetical protein